MVTYFRKIERNVFSFDESSWFFSDALEAGDEERGVVVSLILGGLITTPGQFRTKRTQVGSQLIEKTDGVLKIQTSVRRAKRRRKEIGSARYWSIWDDEIGFGCLSIGKDSGSLVAISAGDPGKEKYTGKIRGSGPGSTCKRVDSKISKMSLRWGFHKIRVYLIMLFAAYGRESAVYFEVPRRVRIRHFESARVWSCPWGYLTIHYSGVTVYTPQISAGLGMATINIFIEQTRWTIMGEMRVERSRQARRVVLFHQIGPWVVGWGLFWPLKHWVVKLNSLCPISNPRGGILHARGFASQTWDTSPCGQTHPHRCSIDFSFSSYFNCFSKIVKVMAEIAN